MHTCTVVARVTTTKTETYGHRPPYKKCANVFSILSMWTCFTPPPGGSGGLLRRDDFSLNIEVKSINLVHFESKIKRSMDTSLNTQKQNCKQIEIFYLYFPLKLYSCFTVILYFIPVFHLFSYCFITIMIIWRCALEILVYINGDQTVWDPLR